MKTNKKRQTNTFTHRKINAKLLIYAKAFEIKRNEKNLRAASKTNGNKLHGVPIKWRRPKKFINIFQWNRPEW